MIRLDTFISTLNVKTTIDITMVDEFNNLHRFSTTAEYLDCSGFKKKFIDEYTTTLLMNSEEKTAYDKENFWDHNTSHYIITSMEYDNDPKKSTKFGITASHSSILCDPMTLKQFILLDKAIHIIVVDITDNGLRTDSYELDTDDLIEVIGGHTVIAIDLNHDGAIVLTIKGHISASKGVIKDD